MIADDALDKILIEMGDFGRYQMFTFGLVCFSVILHSAVHIAYVFTAMDVDYRCEIPHCDVGNVTTYDPSWLDYAVPYYNGKPSKCEKYVPVRPNYGCSAGDFLINNITTCNDYIFDTPEHTILREYNLYCDDNLWKLTLVGTMNNIGQFFGLYVSGVVSDKYGRRFVLIMGMVCCGFFGLIKALSPSYIWFLVFEFWDAFFGSGTYACGFIMGVELVAPKKRVLTGTLVSSTYAIGEVFAAGAAWATEDWRKTLYAIYAPPFILLSLFWLIPESVRWNLSKGNVEKAKNTLRKCAKYNGTTLLESSLDKLDLVEADDKRNKLSFLSILKSPTLLVRFINCSFCWITCAFLFYGLTLNSVSLSGNSYLDFIFTSLIEIPAYIACTLFVDKIGRKLALGGSFVITCVACFSFIFISSGNYVQSLVVYLIGKFGATAAFTIIYVVTSELFPTPLRHTTMGLCSTIGRIGSIISPQTPLLAQLWYPLPLVMFSCMAAVAAFLTIFFPETLNIKLPDTIEEAENIGALKIKEKNKESQMS